MSPFSSKKRERESDEPQKAGHKDDHQGQTNASMVEQEQEQTEAPRIASQSTPFNFNMAEISQFAQGFLSKLQSVSQSQECKWFLLQQHATDNFGGEEGKSEYKEKSKQLLLSAMEPYDAPIRDQDDSSTRLEEFEGGIDECIQTWWVKSPSNLALLLELVLEECTPVWHRMLVDTRRLADADFTSSSPFPLKFSLVNRLQLDGNPIIPVIAEKLFSLDSVIRGSFNQPGCLSVEDFTSVVTLLRRYGLPVDESYTPVYDVESHEQQQFNLLNVIVAQIPEHKASGGGETLKLSHSPMPKSTTLHALCELGEPFPLAAFLNTPVDAITAATFETEAHRHVLTAEHWSNKQSHTGNTPLLSCLTRYGENVSHALAMGDSDLHRRTMTKYRQSLSMLFAIDTSLNLEFTNSKGETALHLACAADDFVLVSHLVNHCPGVRYYRDKDNLRPHERCRRNVVRDCVEVFPWEIKLADLDLTMEDINGNLYGRASAHSSEPEKHLGQGMYGNVARALWMRETQVAVKIHTVASSLPSSQSAPNTSLPVSVELSNLQALFSQFPLGNSANDAGPAWRRELNVLRRPRHPNVLQVWGAVWPEGDTPPLIVLDYADGGSLETVVENCKLEGGGARIYVEDVVFWLWGVSCGMQHLHSLDPPIIHRDLKLGNILLKRRAGSDSTPLLVRSSHNPENPHVTPQNSQNSQSKLAKQSSITGTNNTNSPPRGTNSKRRAQQVVMQAVVADFGLSYLQHQYDESTEAKFSETLDVLTSLDENIPDSVDHCSPEWDLLSFGLVAMSLIACLEFCAAKLGNNNLDYLLISRRDADVHVHDIGTNSMSPTNDPNNFCNPNNPSNDAMDAEAQLNVAQLQLSDRVKTVLLALRSLAGKCGKTLNSFSECSEQLSLLLDTL